MRFAVASKYGAFAALAIASALSSCGSRTPLDNDGLEDEIDFPNGRSDADASTRTACFTSSQPVGEIPIDLYFMMDKSSSMNMFDHGQTVSRWTAVSRAMKTFINSPKSIGLGAGIAFFPRVDSVGNPLCGAGDYAFPVVPIGTIPGVISSISTGIGAQILAAGTPTTPALQGAHIYARTRAQAGRVAAVVIVTDGQPRQCGSSIESTAAAATSAAAGNPAVKTYVLGVGPSLSALNAIAEAGGTGRAYLVESGGEAELTSALDAIRSSAMSCAWVIPENGRKTADRLPAKVSTRVGKDGAPIGIGQVPSADACGSGSGWYYERPPTSDGSPADMAPTRVTLCPGSCDTIVKTSGSELDVVVGCEDVAPTLR